MSNHDTKGRFTKGNKAGLPFVIGNAHGTKHGGYHPELDALARRFCLLTNATDEMLAERLGIGVSTLNRWKREHPSFRASIIAGKESADMDVAEAANFAATGGMVTETQAVKVRVGKGQEDVKIVHVQKYVPPNVQATRMWLMNRSRHWRPENDQPDAKPSQVTNNTVINQTVVVARVNDDLSEIFGDALSRVATDDAPRVN